MATMIEKIRMAIENRGLTQDAVERLAGLPKGRMSKWASGTGEPTARQALRLARFFGLPVEYLIDDECDSPSLAGVLSDAERTILDVYRSLRLPKEDAIRALSLAVPGERVAHGPAMPVGPTREDFGDTRRADPPRRRAKG